MIREACASVARNNSKHVMLDDCFWFQNMVTTYLIGPCFDGVCCLLDDKEGWMDRWVAKFFKKQQEQQEQQAV